MDRKSVVQTIFILAAIFTIVAGIIAIYQVVKPTPPNLLISSSTPQTFSTSQGTTGVTQSLPSPTPRLSPTTTSASTLPCNVNLSTWTSGSPDWQVSNNMLLNDGSNNNAEEGAPTIVAPCQLGNTVNYTVEAQIKVVNHGYNACFGIDARGSTTANGWQGYIGGMFYGCGAYSPMLAIAPDLTASPWLAKIPYDPGNGTHIYRLEVNGNNITFSIDGTQYLAITDNEHLSGGQVGLWSYEVQLNVSSFEVVTA